MEFCKRNIITIIICFTVIIILYNSCSEENDLNPDIETKTIIKPEGGNITIGNIDLEIPEGAVTKEQEIFIDIYDNCDDIIRSDSIHFFKCITCLKPENLNFEKAIRLSLQEDTISYIIIDNNVRVSYDNEDLRLYKIQLGDETPVNLDNNAISINSNMISVSADIMQLGNYQVGINKKHLKTWSGSFIANVTGEITKTIQATSNDLSGSFARITNILLSDNKSLFVNIFNSSKSIVFYMVVTLNEISAGSWELIIDNNNDISVSYNEYGKIVIIQSIANTEAVLELTEIGGPGELISGNISYSGVYIIDGTPEMNVDVVVEFSVRRYLL